MEPVKNALTVARNIVAGFVGYVLAWAALHYVKQWGCEVPDAMSTALPGAVGLLLAHAWDVATGGNKKAD